MTTSPYTPRQLRTQARQIARHLKIALTDPKFAPARQKDSFKIGVFMDDKTITVEMPWTTIRETTALALEEFVLGLMTGKAETLQ